jgi:hypothetical protein
MQHSPRTLLFGLCLAGTVSACAAPASPGASSSSNGGQSTSGGGQGGSSSSSGSGGSDNQGRGGSSGSGGSNVGSGGSGPAAGTGGSQGGGGGGPAAGTGGTTMAGSGGSGAGGGGGRTDGGTGMDTGGRPDTPAAMGDAGGGDPKFSFFVTSLDGMRRLSKSPNGFGGDLRFGETTGLAGADKICQTLAADVGAGDKTWRAFLSTVGGVNGSTQVNAGDRIGNGPWYDRRGRLIAMNKAGLIGSFNRPMGDAAAVNDLPDETGQGTRRLGDTHDVITGTNMMGNLRYPGNLANTCQDWTSATGTGTIQFGHSWPAGSGMHWIQVHTGRSCVAGVNLVQNGAGNGMSIGAGGGWGAIYCFALSQ